MILPSTCNLQHLVFGDNNQTQMTIGEDAQHCKDSNIYNDPEYSDAPLKPIISGVLYLQFKLHSKMSILADTLKW